MRTKVPIKLQKIIEEIDQRGQAGMTRLTAVSYTHLTLPTKRIV